MKKIVTTLALLACCAAPALAANAVRISQVYGGGGGTGAATYKQDYVELFNNSGVPVNIGGWVIEYGSAAGNWGSSATNYFTIPVGTVIQPCKYLSFGFGTVGTGGGNFPIALDFINTAGPNMSATGGKVGLFNALNANVPCGSELAGTLVDKVAYGTANCAEVTAVAALSITTGAVRNGAGTADTDNNLNDFTVVSNPVPRNAASSANPTCAATPTHTSTWGSIKSIYR